jgi:hypothetical protein
MSGKKNTFDYIIFFILEVILVIYSQDNILEKFKLELVYSIMVLNLIPLPLKALIGYINCFIKMELKRFL